MSNQALKAITTGAVAPKPQSFPQYLEAYKGEIARALPAHIKADTLARVALTCFRLNPKLGECHPASVFAAVLQASQLGLRPGMLGECYLIPYKTECQLQIGYQGMLELVRRSGLVESIGAYLVYERDTYDVRFGTDPGITHVPYLDGERGAVKLGYAVARLKGGGVHVEVMPIAEIHKIRDRSQNVMNARKFGKKTPWETDFDEMARKTLLRRICKYLPKSNELATALALDDAAARGNQRLTIDDAAQGLFVPTEALAAPPESEPPAAEQTKAAGPTYAEIMDRINAAKSVEEVNAATPGHALAHLSDDMQAELQEAAMQKIDSLK